MPHTSQSSSSSAMARQPDNPLRRRMHLLHRAHSFTSLPNKIVPIELTHSKQKAGDADQHNELSPLEYESHSDSSDEGESDRRKEKRRDVPSKPITSSSSWQEHAKRPVVDTAVRTPPKSYSRGEASPMTPTSRSWYEFDLAVVVALVSPIGNWLTGGDHVKNLLLIALLIFYLHQIIEVPWTLYRKSRPRRRSPDPPPTTPTSINERYSRLASSELHRLEMLFLLCTLVSPLRGALFLEYATASVLGPDSVSWFSIGLFVLATGMRPWSHLIDRLSRRTSELQDFIHFPEVYSLPSEIEARSSLHIKELEKRIESMERSIHKLKTRVIHTTEDVYEYVDNAVDLVEESVRAQDRRWEKYQGQVKGVEAVVGTAQRDTNLIQRMKEQLILALNKILPSWVASLPIPFFNRYPQSKTIISSPISTPLATIEEEETIDDVEYPFLARRIGPSGIISRLFFRIMDIATMPLRAIVRMVLRRY